MAKPSFRRRVALDKPEGFLALGQTLWEQIRPYAKWLVLGVVVVAVGLGAWGINAGIQARRQAKAAAVLAQMTPKLDPKAPEAEVQTLGKFVTEYGGTRAARDAQLMRANLLYRLKRYGPAAQAYESLLSVREPGWDALVNDSLSYCYEGLGNYKKAAATLQPVVDQTYGPLKSEVMRRLATLYDKAGEPKEAAIYWRKLVGNSPDAVLVPYFQAKLAAAEAKIKK
jgi:predicted negative regulator of RcsB-dependent stress response